MADRHSKADEPEIVVDPEERAKFITCTPFTPGDLTTEAQRGRRPQPNAD
jgi:hypothetical protein